jgi:RNA polymerase sigma-70 factor (ECF subfamily)
MAASNQADSRPERQLAEADRDLLARYVDAFQRYDIDSLVTLLHEDAGFSMPPLKMWLQGRSEVRGFYLGHGIGCRGSRLIPVTANGSPAFGHYKPSQDGSGYTPWALQVIEIDGGRIQHLHHFLDPGLFEMFGLPPALD